MPDIAAPIISPARSGTERSSSSSPGSAALLALLDHLPNAILCLDSAWRITYANAKAMAISRLTPADICGKTHWELFPDTVGQPLETLYRQVMTTRIAGHIEYHHQPFSIWVDIHVIPIDTDIDTSIVLHYSDITNRKRVESFNIATARQLEQAFEATTDAVMSIDHDWIITFINQQVPTLVGKHDLVGKNHWQEFPEAIHTKVYENYYRAMREHVPVDFEDFYPPPLNKWFSLQVRPSDDGIVVFFRDISKERAVRQDLLDQQATLTFVKQTARVATWIIDFTTGAMIIGDGSYPVFGRPNEQIDSLEAFRAIVHPDDREILRLNTRKAIETHAVITTDYRVLAPGGSVLWLEGRGMALYDDHGNVTHLRGMTTDITGRKENEQRFAVSEAGYRVLAERLREEQQEAERQRAELETVYRTAPVGLGLFDPVEFRYLRLNDRLAEIIGKPIDQILGHIVSEIAPPAVRTILEQVVSERTMQRRLIEGEFPGRPGELHHFNVNYSPVFASNGSIQAIATATLDITHQKKAETALIQSEKLAAVGRLASSISHEINNPLEAITNLLFLIALDDNLPEPVKVYVHMAQSELGRVSQIVTQTLRFHRQAVNPTEVTAADLVNAVLNLYQGRLSNSAIRIEAHYASNSKILCFENDIRQVLNNLIANAIDAMRSGGRLVIRAHNVSAANSPSGQAGVRIAIADTGHGMNSDVAKRIYEPFFTTKDLNGTGLGLWISAGIVGHHNGSLTVRSSQHPTHHGTVFTLFLPTTPSSST